MSAPGSDALADSNNKNIDWLLFFELIDYPDERHSVLITQRDLFLSADHRPAA
jgi:hypothetical protein